jgi:hypothetical protein
MLDTPRVGAGGAESALSEKPRAPPDYDVNDLTEQVRRRFRTRQCSFYRKFWARNDFCQFHRCELQPWNR